MPERRDHPEKQSDTDFLRQEVAALTVSIQGLASKLDDAMTHDEASRKFVSREDVRRARKRMIWTVVISVLLAFFVTLGGDNFAIKHCFLGSTRSLRASSFCNTVFPGYNAAIKNQKATLTQFSQVLAEIPKNSKHNAEQDKQLQQMKTELDAIARRLGVKLPKGP